MCGLCVYVCCVCVCDACGVCVMYMWFIDICVQDAST